MQNVPPAAPPPVTSPPVPQGKKRHGCLTAWLILIIIANALVAILYAVGSSALGTLDIPSWSIWVSVIMDVFIIICAVGLFMWKKWGFWGFCAAAVIGIIINISSGGPIYAIISPIISVLVLFGVLNIGKENKGWPQLE